MKHLTIDRIIDFVSISEMDKASLELSFFVNEHIRECEECLEKVRAYQDVYDEFVRLGSIGDFKGFAYSVIPEKVAENAGAVEIEKALKLSESEN